MHCDNEVGSLQVGTSQKLVKGIVKNQRFLLFKSDDYIAKVVSLFNKISTHTILHLYPVCVHSHERHLK